jgi:hypothetical protein
MPGNDNNGWNEWSKHVLLELERLNEKSEVIRAEISKVQNDITKLSTVKDGIEDLKEWKKNVDEVASPSQLKELRGTVEELKMFKTKAVTIFAVVQVLMGLFIALKDINFF